VTDTDTVIERLKSRTSNTFGQHPEEIRAVIQQNKNLESTNRPRGATIIDAGQILSKVTDAVLTAAAATPHIATRSGPAK
jgi:hypothetical protein